MDTQDEMLPPTTVSSTYTKQISVKRPNCDTEVSVALTHKEWINECDSETELEDTTYQFFRSHCKDTWVAISFLISSSLIVEISLSRTPLALF